MDQNLVDYSWFRSYFDSLDRQLASVRGDLGTVNENVGETFRNVNIARTELQELAEEFHSFVSEMRNKTNEAEARDNLVLINQEIEKKFGHHDSVRRHVTGILQADDLGLVKKQTISTATEEIMLDTPGYWLAPALVALAAWINDNPSLAEKAVREALNRNDEKTSLFFALICRRAGRLPSALMWTKRYLDNQEEDNIDRKTVIVLDAYASGLLGQDSEGMVSKKITEWVDHLSAAPGFIDQQRKQWSDALLAKKPKLSDNVYKYLPKYSKTWPQIKDVMEGSLLNETILRFFTDIFDKEASTSTLKEQMDEILTTLVSEFDEAETALRTKKKYNEYVLEFGGDKDRAQQKMDIEITAFEEKKDFTQLLTDSAMKPESAHASVSTQKFAIALSRDWITDAFNDVVAQNRKKIPQDISINIDSFNGTTTDGTNEAALTEKLKQVVQNEKNAALDKIQISGGQKAKMVAGIIIAALGLILAFDSTILGLIAIVAGGLMVVSFFSNKKKLEELRVSTRKKFEEKEKKCLEVLRATIADVVDFRRQFAKIDGKSKDVLQFLESISPEQYVKQLSGNTRKIVTTD